MGFSFHRCILWSVGRYFTDQCGALCYNFPYKNQWCIKYSRKKFCKSSSAIHNETESQTESIWIICMYMCVYVYMYVYVIRGYMYAFIYNSMRKRLGFVQDSDKPKLLGQSSPNGIFNRWSYGTLGRIRKKNCASWRVTQIKLFRILRYMTSQTFRHYL